MGLSSRSNPLPPELVEEMAQLMKCGISLIPLGGGDDGKRPLISFAKKPALKLGQVLGPMNGKGSTCYGIRLDGVLVLDLDTDDSTLVRELEARFGASPVHVRTPRGRHLYYRDTGWRPNLKSEGLVVDVKAGANSYVVGARSVRPDGGEYISIKGGLGETTLPALKTETDSPSRVLRINVGQRNTALWQAAIKMVEFVDDADELFQNLRHQADTECEDPQTITDDELRGIAKWAWEKRCSNDVWTEGRGAIRIGRDILDTLRDTQNYSDALGLFVTLQDKHGHIAGRAFALKHKPMREAGLTDLSRERFTAARDTLIEAGPLAIAAKHQAGRHSTQYRLTRPVRMLSENLIALRDGNSKGEGL